MAHSGCVQCYARIIHLQLLIKQKHDVLHSNVRLVQRKQMSHRLIGTIPQNCTKYYFVTTSFAAQIHVIINLRVIQLHEQLFIKLAM